VSLRFCSDDVILVNWLLECPLIFYLEGLILDILITIFYCTVVVIFGFGANGKWSLLPAADEACCIKVLLREID
jgi:hypothetical protein